MPSKPSRPVWPREYLLRIYNSAVQYGHILIHPISESDANSLRMTLYRLRRPDMATEKFITPEMHLVTVGSWRSEANGTLPIYYNTVPDSEPPLPTITPVHGTPIADLGPDIDLPEPEDLIPGSPGHWAGPEDWTPATSSVGAADAEVAPEIDRDAYLESLKRAAHERKERGDG